MSRKIVMTLVCILVLGLSGCGDTLTLNQYNTSEIWYIAYTDIDTVCESNELTADGSSILHSEEDYAIAGTFLVVGLTEDDFTSLTPEQIEKFKEKYQSPEIFTLFNGELHVMKMPPEEAKEQKEKQKKDAQQKNPAKGKKKNRSGESR